MSVDLSKITSIIKEMGISEDTCTKFSTILESWIDTERKKLQEEYKARLDKAKKICVEEVETHKASLSRGIQIFLESKVEEIQKVATKQSAIVESEAINKVKQVKELLGIKIDSSNDQTLQAESKKNADLVKELATIKEEIAREKAKNTKFGTLIEKGLERQKDLEKRLNESKNILEETKTHLQKKTNILEGKTKKSIPLTTQKVISESDKKSDKAKLISGNSEIDNIANQMT